MRSVKSDSSDGVLTTLTSMDLYGITREEAETQWTLHQWTVGSGARRKRRARRTVLHFIDDGIIITDV